MKIAVLAVQGAFIEHERKLEVLGASCVELRKAEDLNQSYDGLVLPGGEVRYRGSFYGSLGCCTIRKQIKEGLPVLATCAGMILLADSLEGDAMVHLQTVPMTVKRNAYGRQLGSFHTEAEFKGIGEIPMTFIRAPYVADVSDGVEVLAVVQDRIVAVRYGKQMALAFHPELDEDERVHREFLRMCEGK